MRATRTVLSWSSGKDSATALSALQAEPGIEIVALLTTINAEAGRVAMHAVRRELLELQAEAAGLPLWTIDLPWPCSNQAYEAAMGGGIERALGAGVTQMAFGDLFVADIRDYREAQLAGTGITPVFPLWQRDTRGLADQMVRDGVRAVLTCVDTRQVDAGFAGRAFDAGLLADLPPGCDPCGERGEFHTFAWDAPAFEHPVPVRVGDTEVRDGFAFADLLPA